MSNTLQEMTQDIQARIREAAYLMWEAAGRQQGMAMEYWLRAEQEVLATLQAAATRMMPGARTAGTSAEAKPAESSTPALETTASSSSPAAVPGAAPAAALATETAAETEKAAVRKPAARGKAKA